MLRVVSNDGSRVFQRNSSFIIQPRLLSLSFSLAFLFLVGSPGTAVAQSQVFAKWVARYDGAHAFDAPAAMAADWRGNTFVTGESCVDNPCADLESVTIKYDSNGHVVWRAFLSSAGRAAQGIGIALDSAGNVYVLSLLWQVKDQSNSVSEPEVATAKYSPSGARQWVNFIASSATVNRSPGQLAVSREGNVYITMVSSPINSVNSDVTTIKYDTNGKQAWSKVASPTPDQGNSPVAIRLDAAENVYVLVFSSFSSQIHESVIFRYDSSGNLLNSFGADTLGTIVAFRVDAQGHSYVAGGGSPQPPSGAEAPIVAKFNTDGTTAWFDDFGPPPSQVPSPSNFVDLAIDPAGQVFVAQTLPGAIPANNGRDISVMKFDSAGHKLWATRYNGHSDDSGFDQAVALAVNSMGEPYVAGTSSSTSVACCLPEFATIKYDTKGNQVWVERYNSPGSNGGSPVAIVLSRGDVLITGQSDGTATSTDWATIDYVQDGAKVSPAALDFGNQPGKTQSAIQTATLTNTAEVPLSISGIEITGDFQLINNCPNELTPGESCSLGVTFSPTAPGARSGTLTLHDNWAGSATDPQTVKLTGTGTN